MPVTGNLAPFGRVRDADGWLEWLRIGRLLAGAALFIQISKPVQASPSFDRKIPLRYVTHVRERLIDCADSIVEILDEALELADLRRLV